MTPEDEKIIAGWVAGTKRPGMITLRLSGDPRADALSSFCERLSRLAPGVSVLKEEAGADALPGIRVGHNVIYHAVPSQRELEPFLENLSRLLEEPPGGPSPLGPLAEVPPLPAFLKIFVTPACPFCPTTVREILPVCATFPFVQVAVIDGALFPELAQTHGIKAVPTVILDDAFRWTGTLKAKELLEVLAHRDPSGLSAAALERMLKEGDAKRLSEMMIRKKEIFPAFLDLLFHVSWSVRMGAMVVVEELSERDPELAREVIEPVQARFDQAEDTVKGDLLYVLGELRVARLIPVFHRILAGPYSKEVKDAAQEAIEKMQAP